MTQPRLPASPPSTKGQTFPVEPLTPAEARRLLDSCSRRSRSGQRLAALVAVACRSGLRLAELLALELRDQRRGLSTVRASCTSCRPTTRT